ncbi:MAG: outer membrane beta-barrel protein [Calditrichaeota bacterium]|nr:outer membrane beta-barrel protein [Calditrichota bacterium]MCB9367045.1 outer membrane beta-barrel protein [Calditrichota bacterium]MCB9391471.1 outer membrane beta-barrel protein [Calditrichota bacterium]
MKILGMFVLAGLLATAARADYPLGVGLHGGYDMPVIQEDVGAGPVFGVSVRGNIVGPLHGQLVFRSTSQGDVEEDIDFPGEPTLTIPGGTLTGFGLNVLLAAKEPQSFWPYFHLGLSSNSLSPGADYKKDESLTGMSGGVGAGINLYQKQIYLDIMTSLLVMPFHDDNASRKNWQTMLGVQYFVPIKTKKN